MKLEAREFERRCMTDTSAVIGLEKREIDGSKKDIIVGYPIVYNTLSVDMGGFRERIKPGAFDESIERNDIVLLGHHDSQMPVARHSNDTLTSYLDDIGVRIEATPDTSVGYIDDIAKVVASKLITKMSFGFYIEEEEWVEEDGQLIREIVKGDVIEYSIVLWPAFDATVVSKRAVEHGKQLRAKAENKAEHGKPSTMGINKTEGTPHLDSLRQKKLLRKKNRILRG